eukprot:gene56456-75386_t
MIISLIFTNYNASASHSLGQPMWGMFNCGRKAVPVDDK